jgi:hypothetical protein
VSPREEFTIWRFFQTMEPNVKLHVTPRLYRAMRHHPHFRHMMARVRKMDPNKCAFGLSNDTVTNHIWLDEAQHLDPNKVIKGRYLATPKKAG